ncbi:PREDICTED: abscisic acid 8'-hydroxylase 4 [Tarenaya hassleriana]|uniref:abscisic acid 8'-hydroxylase 4 n=1 Tax=Tarenaya hassleriana TaxID=28532 RepID=UPI0008FCF77D|nr:PREDICTED: abscisic acid 8'-hydroxylase 4 [Tarenaya hassleriana]
MISLLHLLHLCLCLCKFLLVCILIITLRKIFQIRSEGRSKSTAEIPPGSDGFPVIGETLQFMFSANSGKGFYEFVRTRHLKYGYCFRTNLFGETHVFVSTTESARAVLNNESNRFTKRYIKSIAELVGDQSLLCAPHHHHKILRSRLINLFSTKSTALMIRSFDEIVIDSLRGWEHRRTVVLLTELLKLTFKAMCKMLVSLEDEEHMSLLQHDVALVCEAMLAFPLKLPWTRFNRGIKARGRVMKVLERIIRERRSGSHHHEDFLQHLLTNNSGQATRLSEAEIKDNILTMIIAGQDTTASALTWMVKYLGENQKVLDILTEEQLQISKKSSDKPFLSVEDLSKMSYASKMAKESLRMASVVPWFPRLALQDCEIEGYMIKKGWNINIDARSIHLDPNVYNDPHIFNPSRFDEEDAKSNSFLAFGMGGRTCLGHTMAKAMIFVFLHRFVTTYRWEVVDKDPTIEKCRIEKFTVDIPTIQS